MSNTATAERMIAHLKRRGLTMPIPETTSTPVRPVVLFLAPKVVHPGDQPSRPVSLHYPDKNGDPLCGHSTEPAYWEIREVPDHELARRKVCSRCVTQRDRYTSH